MPNPETHADGLGELIRAMRLYIGLSQRELIRRLHMDRRTYQRIESGAEQCPPGFIDTMRRLTDEFDEQVEETIKTAERMVGTGDEVVCFNITDRDEDVWARTVIGRAAVESELIMPTLVGTPH